eukprot:COSAG02_NODE_3159_length_7255_cov_15.875629_8_plen_60_part_01
MQLLWKVCLLALFFFFFFSVAVWPGRGEGGEEVTSSEQLAEMQSQLQQALDQQAQLSSQQ